MFILPFSTEMRLQRLPYVTFGVIVLCFVIFFFQQASKEAVSKAATQYCHTIHKSEGKIDHYDYMVRDEAACAYFLKLMHQLPDLSVWIDYNLAIFGDQYTRQELEKYSKYEYQHYADFSRDAPPSLDAHLIYNPYSLNPIAMITSALAHANWPHIIFNLIFFFAFAPALEILIDSSWKYLGVLIAIALIDGVMDSLLSYYNASPIPSLGFSGCVMGMIGFSAFMIPRARIRTVVWWVFHLRRYYIPAWVLAAWYIGGNIYDLVLTGNDSGIDFMAHVAGGLSGYVIARLFFANQKQAYQDQIDDEIDFLVSHRGDRLGIMSSYKGDRARIDRERAEHLHKRQWANFISRIHKCVMSGNHAEAVYHLLNDYDLYAQSPEIYEELFAEIGQWKKTRTYDCLGRLLVDLYVNARKYGLALRVVTTCLAHDPDFVLAEPANVLLLANEAVSLQQTETAYALVRDFPRRYPYTPAIPCVLLAAKLLWMHHSDANAALDLLAKAHSSATDQDRPALDNLTRLIRDAES